MHIVLGLLGAIVTILILLKRLDNAGIDVGWLNPFAWHRRRSFRKRYDTNPIYTLDNPMDVAALVLLGVTKRDGELSSIEKATLLEVFEEEFHLSAKASAALLGASSHLLRDGDALSYQLDKVLKPSEERFTPEQAESTIELMQRMANTDGSASALQSQLIRDVKTILVDRRTPEGKWA